LLEILSKNKIVIARNNLKNAKVLAVTKLKICDLVNSTNYISYFTCKKVGMNSKESVFMKPMNVILSLVKLIQCIE